MTYFGLHVLLSMIPWTLGYFQTNLTNLISYGSSWIYNDQSVRFCTAKGCACTICSSLPHLWPHL